MPSKGDLPQPVQRTRDWLETSGAQSGAATDIRQINEAMHPNDDPWLNLITKSRISPQIERDVAWLMAEAAADGEIEFSSLGKQTGDLNIATQFTAMKLANSYATQGKAREELVRVLTGGARRFSRGLRSMFGRGQQYDDSGSFQ